MELLYQQNKVKSIKTVLDTTPLCGYSNYMNKLNYQKRTEVITALVEGNSINSTVRMTGVHKTTILHLLADVGSRCADYQDRSFRNLKCKPVQCDEVWQFCYAKEKNVPADKKGKFGFGDTWTWVAIDADTKLVPSFMLGNRDFQTVQIFIDDLKARLENRMQLTTDARGSIWTQWRIHLGVMSIMHNWQRFTLRLRRKQDTARLNAWAVKNRSSGETLNPSTFLPVL